MSAAPTEAVQRPQLLDFWRDLPREGRMLLSIVVLEFLGTGLVLPFNVIYLHEVRGFDLSQVGLLLAIPSIAGFVVVGPGGWAIDHVGARRVQMLTLALLLVGDLVLAFATVPGVAALALALNGAAFGLSWPAWQSLVAAVIPTHLRQRYFGVNFTLLNLGIGIGGIGGGLFVDVTRPVTFETIYLIDAASYLPALLLLLGPLRHVAGKAEPHHDPAGGPVGYLAVLRRPAVASMLALSFLSSFVGYAQLNVGMPAYARAVGHVSTEGLGLAFGANTVVIVLLQLVVLQRIEGRRRTRVIAVMGVMWAVAWLLLGAAGLVAGTVGATVLVAACASVFALGETLLQPTIPALTNDLAPDHLRGRYNALSSGAFNLAAVVAPVVSGVLIGRSLSAAYVVVLVVGSLALAVYSVGRVEGQLPAGVNGVTGRQPTGAQPE